MSKMFVIFKFVYLFLAMTCIEIYYRIVHNQGFTNKNFNKYVQFEMQLLFFKCSNFVFLFCLILNTKETNKIIQNFQFLLYMSFIFIYEMYP